MHQSSYNTITLGTITGQPGHMPTVIHTHQWETTLTLSFAREICWSCIDRVLHRLPLVAIHHCHMDKLHCSYDSTTTWRSTTKPIRHAERTNTKAQSLNHDTNSARCMTLPNYSPRPRASHLSTCRDKSPPTSPQAVTDSKTVPPRGRIWTSPSIVQSRGSEISLRSKDHGTEERHPQRHLQESQWHPRVSSSPALSKAWTDISPRNLNFLPPELNNYDLKPNLHGWPTKDTAVAISAQTARAPPPCR
jgi:hypothetical protein